MPTYNIIINGEKREELVTGANYMDAYFNAVKIVPHAYKNDFRLSEIDENK